MNFVTINLLYSNVRLVFWSMASINKELHVKAQFVERVIKEAEFNLQYRV